MRERSLPLLALLALSLAVVPDLHADPGDAFFKRGEEGWFWYREPPPEPEEDAKPEAPPAPLPPAPSPSAPVAPTPEPTPQAKQGPAPFSAAWLREELPKYRERAIDHPTAENVQAVLYLQRIALDKSTTFAEVSERVSTLDPVLDESLRRPAMPMGAKVADEQAGDELDATLRSLAETAGILFIFDSQCRFCAAQAPLLESFQRLYGFSVRAVSIDGAGLPGGQFADFYPDRGLSTRLNVMQTPALFLIRPPDQIAGISQGLVSLEDLRRRVLLTAVSSGWVTPETFEKTRPVQARNGRLDLNGNDVPQSVLDDPARLVGFLRERLRK